MRGSSGARIIPVSTHTVAKIGDIKVGRQGLWMQNHPLTIFPKIHSVYPMSYTMDRLISIHPKMLNHVIVCHNMIDRLASEVWSQKPEVIFDIRAMEDKMAQLFLPNYVKILNKHIYDINWDLLPMCLTHGDPTFDNVMFKQDSSDVMLIDPIPATPGIPDLRCVDLGKIMQSCLGFEAKRYESKEQQFRYPAENFLEYLTMMGYDKNEIKATIVWSAIHILRAIPYMPSERIQDDMVGLIDEAIYFL